MRIVADAAIPGIRAALAGVGDVTLVPGRAIDATALAGADALVVRSVTRVDADLLGGSAVRFVGSATIGTDHVDLPWLADHGIKFAHAPGCNARAVAQYVTTATHLRAVAAPEQRHLASCRIGIIGGGNVGREVARLFRALGREVWINDPPREKAAAQEGSDDESYVDLDRLLAGCELVTLHVPLTRGGAFPTHGLLPDVMVRDLLSRGGLLINTSRGGVMAEAPALDPSPGGLVLDVWRGEPNLRWPLLADDSAVALGTPHVAGYTAEGKHNATERMRDALCEFSGTSRGADATKPARVRDPIVASGRPTPLGNFADILVQANPLRRDDLALREVAAKPPEQRAAAFDRLRNQYQLRREFEAFVVDPRDASRSPLWPQGPDLATALVAVGFRTV